MLTASFQDLGILFLTSFTAATLLPVQSEIVLAALHYADEHSKWILWSVATTGNVLGAFVNWLLGRYLMHFKDRRWFPIKEKSLTKATTIYQHYGVWTLLLAWMPFIGDPLTLVAGIFRTRLLTFLVLVTLGKGGRYALILWLL